MTGVDPDQIAPSGAVWYGSTLFPNLSVRKLRTIKVVRNYKDKLNTNRKQTPKPISDYQPVE